MCALSTENEYQEMIKAENIKKRRVKCHRLSIYWGRYIGSIFWRQSKSLVLQQYKKIYKSWVYIGAVIYAAHGSIQSLAEPQWPKRGLRDSLRAPSSSSLVLPTFGQILRSKEVPDLPRGNDLTMISEFSAWGQWPWFNLSHNGCLWAWYSA